MVWSNLRTALWVSSFLGASDAFVVVPPRFASQSCKQHDGTSFQLLSKKSADEGGEQHQQQAFAVGTFVEFIEKNRVHIGKIEEVEHKASGGARYRVLDSEDKMFDIPDKSIKYSMACPNSPGQANKLYQEFCQMQDFPLTSIQEKLDITPELLEMAWEETAAEFETEDEANEGASGQHHLLTSSSFIELVHAHAASAMEKYYAWKLLQSEMSHVFFKEIKENGRVVAFKAKTRKAVQNAKEMFCRNHENNEICFV